MECSEERRMNVARFVTMYTLFNKLAEEPVDDEDDDMSTGEPVELCKPEPFNTDLAAGQIRLLGCDTSRMTYVVLLRRWEDDSFVVMPFSAFKYPATDEEFKPSYDGGVFQHVLQAWNTRTVADDMLKRSWLVGELPQQDIDDAWRMWEHTLGGKALDAGLLSRTGLPIYRDHDPRLRYKQDELDNMKMWVQ